MAYKDSFETVNFPILKDRAELQVWRKQQNAQIHFVPTMGGLHKGHGQLIKFAKKIKERKPANVLLSIFINPLQFGPEEDYQKYPRNLEADAELAYKYGADAIWAPSINDIFPRGSESHFQIIVPSHLKKYLCGAKRKKHFDGVATIIMHLVNIIKPNKLILGEKDWQQLIIIRNLIKEIGLPIVIHSAPTYRDIDGLAYSSRNNYLSKAERDKALILPSTLKKIAYEYSKSKSLNLKNIKTSLEKKDLQVEYIEHVDLELLNPIEQSNKLSLLAAAVQCGQTRLIDHIFLMTRKPIVAIDGPAGAGKSTVTKKFAETLGLIYLDTGAMYRAVTWLIDKEKVNPTNENELSNILSTLKLKLEITKEGKQIVLINDKDVTNTIRSPKITALVSTVAAQKLVREALTTQQKQIGLNGGLVAEGRDIGTAVFPDAELKVYLTASAEERAKRRATDLKENGYDVPNLIELESQIKERDEIDSKRMIAPLQKAKDAYELITDQMTIDEVIEKLIYLFRLKVPQECWPSIVDQY